MTDQARRLLDALHSRVVARSPAPVIDEPMRVEICLSGSPHSAAADELKESIQGQLTALLDELGLDRTLAITTAIADSETTGTTVSIDGRPVANLRPAHLRSDAAGALLDDVLSRILRRLPLLAGPAVGVGSTSAYVMTLGCRGPSGTTADAFDVDVAERQIDDRSGEHILLEVATSTMRRVEGAGTRAMVGLREAESRKWGVTYPDVSVVLTDHRPGTVRLRLNDVTLPARRLGEHAMWNDVVKYVGAVLADKRHWFVRMRNVSRAMDESLVHTFPDLVAVADANYSRAELTACMRELVRGGQRMRDIARILWLMVEAGGSPAGSDILRMSESPLLPKARHRPPAERDPIVQAIRVRKLGTEEDWRLGNYRAPRHAVRLDINIEERLVAEGQTEDLAHAEWAAVRALATAPEARLVVTRTLKALGPVRDAIQAVENVPHVVASHALPPDADLSALPILADPIGHI
ncbi:MAG TPA: hypothetical protein VIW24_09080 [Aldersonia sp.]